MINSMDNKTIDNYRLLKKVGQGGMGMVYKALDVDLDMVVAIKMMTPTLSNDDLFKKRFRKEAQTLAKLQDENIVKVYSLRDSEHGLMIVMEFVDGISLAQKIKQTGPIHFQQALPLLKQMVSAIDHAHHMGIVHRDIKPQNILLTQDNVIKITDFGLAKFQHKNETAVSGFAGGNSSLYVS